MRTQGIVSKIILGLVIPFEHSLTAVHAWDYRRYVIASLPKTFSPPRTAADELKYTQKKIEANFSNFSAWHLRTKLLGSIWEDLSPEEVARAKDKGKSHRLNTPHGIPAVVSIDNQSSNS